MARLVAILEATTDFVAMTDAKGAVLYVNRAGRRLVGLAETENISGTHIADFHPPWAARVIMHDAIPRSINESVWRGETALLNYDGHEIPVSQVVLAHKNANGSVDFLSTIARDMTESKRAEEVRARLATAVEQAAESIIITDCDGIIQYVNPAFEKITGYSRAEVIDQNPRLLKSGRQDAAFYQQMWETIRRGEVWIGQLTNKKKDGSLYDVDATISPVRDGDGKIINFVSASRDVTHERKIEEQLRQSQKMQAVGRLAGGVAHDFNNILTVIMGYCTMLLRESAIAGGPARKNVEEIQKGAERAVNLTRQLLAFSRKQVLQPKVLDLNAVLMGTDRMLRRLIGEDIELRIACAQKLGAVKADQGQIEQVVMNLVVNARDAMPRGGKITIETADATLHQKEITPHGAIDPGHYVTITVTDNGVGMSEEIKAHLFEPFFTTKGTEGTGLGLATCYGIVKQTGGYIQVFSEQGRGTSVIIYLPVTSENTKGQGARPDSSVTKKGNETLLIVEDESALRELTACVLREAGYTVLEACDGRDGLRVAGEDLSRRIDLVVTDVIMPRMSGKEMADKLKSVRPHTKVLFISGYTDDALNQHGVLSPDIAFLEKPFTPARLAFKVREVLDQAGPNGDRPKTDHNLAPPPVAPAAV
jgi:PAS domain S-box-containing protein